MLEMTTTLNVIKAGVARMAFYELSYAEWLTTDQAMGHSPAQMGTPKTQVVSDTGLAQKMLPRSMALDTLRDTVPAAIINISIDVIDQIVCNCADACPI